MIFFVGLLQVLSQNKVQNKKKRVIFQVMCKLLLSFQKYLFIILKYPIDVAWLFICFLHTTELNYDFKLKFDWGQVVDFENGIFIDNLDIFVQFELVDNFNLHTLFGQIENN